MSNEFKSAIRTCIKLTIDVNFCTILISILCMAVGKICFNVPLKESFSWTSIIITFAFIITLIADFLTLFPYVTEQKYDSVGDFIVKSLFKD